MFISREELNHLYKRLDELQQQVNKIDTTYTVYNDYPSRPIDIPLQTVIGAIIEHLGVQPLAMPPQKTSASMHFVKKTPTTNKE